MDTLDVIQARRSVRSFDDRQVPREILEKLVDAGRLAPTAINIQPWEFVVVTDEAFKKRVAATTDYGKFIADAPAAIAVFCKDTKYYLEDGCAATTNMLIAAADLGLGACWVAGDKKPYCNEVRQALSVPDNYKLVSLIAVGYPAGPPPEVPKRPLAELIHWNTF